MLHVHWFTFLWEAFRALQPSERDSKLSKATESHRQELGSANQGPSGDFMVPQMGPSRHSSDCVQLETTTLSVNLGM